MLATSGIAARETAVHSDRYAARMLLLQRSQPLTDLIITNKIGITLAPIPVRTQGVIRRNQTLIQAIELIANSWVRSMQIVIRQLAPVPRIVKIDYVPRVGRLNQKGSKGLCDVVPGCFG